MKIAKTTNVNPTDLNYDHYTRSQYDRDIVNAIPFHKEIHLQLADYITKHFASNCAAEIIDLGTGTALTSAVIRSILPQAHFDLIDFSKQMLSGAKKKMGTKNIRYILADFATLKFDKKYDIAVTVIGLHHQTVSGTKKLFKKIYHNLKPGGILIIGDLVTYTDKNKAALNNALHYKHLVDKATNEKVLTEWAHHHMYLNDLKPLEDQIHWMKDVGFKIVWQFNKWNTALIIGKK